MKQSVYEKHERLRAFPPAHLAYIIYRRVIEHGLRPTWLWIKDKILRRFHGFTQPDLGKVAPHVYVGGQHTRRGIDRMRELGITAVVNLREESDDEAHGRLLDTYLWLPTPDDDPPTIDDLARGVAFIEAQVEAGRDVYIHCASGVGRAPTMAAAYLVWRGTSPEEAWHTIQDVRPFVRPTPPQVEVIQEFDRYVRAHPTAGPKTEPSKEPIPSQASKVAHMNLGKISEAAPKVPSDDEADQEGEEAAALTPPVGPAQVIEETASNAQRVQLAFERIAGDPQITGDLMDEPARVLLDWAQEEVVRLVQDTASMDEEAAWARLDPKIQQLRRYLRRTAKQSAEAEDPTTALRQTLHSPTYE